MRYYGTIPVYRAFMIKVNFWTKCKETVVSELRQFSQKHTVDILTRNPCSKKDIQQVTTYLNHKCRAIGFSDVKITRYTENTSPQANKLFKLEFDRRWVNNPVIGTMFFTFVRRKFCLVNKVASIDDEHLKRGKWLVRKLYEGYDGLTEVVPENNVSGFVAFSNRLRGIGPKVPAKYRKILNKYKEAKKNRIK